jgi:hypothetical protein
MLRAARRRRFDAHGEVFLAARAIEPSRGPIVTAR